MKLDKDFIELCISRLAIIADIILDCIVVSVLIICFSIVEKLATLLGYENLFVMNIIKFCLDPIILISVASLTVIRFYKEHSYLPSNSRYKLEDGKKPDTPSKKSDTPSKYTNYEDSSDKVINRAQRYSNKIKKRRK